jgi:hypothetical protein
MVLVRDNVRTRCNNAPHPFVIGTDPDLGPLESLNADIEDVATWNKIIVQVRSPSMQSSS